MKIAIFSDLHIGFAKGSARESEAFDQAKQAFELALKERADLILLAGDLFNEATPSQEAWLGMFRLFSVLKSEGNRGTAKIRKIKKVQSEEFSFSHIPVISIAGTHEFRSKDFKNALEVLQEAGCLVFLHAAKAEFELNSEKLVVHGLSGVPEKKALDALKMWSPKPEPNASNIILLHQSIKEFLPFDDDMVASISLDDLPQGFDLVVDGHLHWASQDNLDTRNFLVTGSTVVTQMKKLEAKKPKGIFLFETKGKKLNFLPLPDQRKFLFEKLEFKEGTQEQIKGAVEKTLASLLSNSQGKPLIKLKLKGSLAKGLSRADIDLRQLEQKFREKAILFIDQDFEEAGFKEKLEKLREAHLGKKSIAAMGFELLEKNLGETNFNEAFDAKRVFDLLETGDIDKVVELLAEAKK
jgi:DNA repair exonuclease SbcCD nuclease subunit